MMTAAKKRKYAVLVTVAAVLTGSFVTSNASAQDAASFADVPQNAWYREAVDFVSDKGYLSGTSADEFSPNKDMTRGMFVTALGRMSGENIPVRGSGSFSDVDSEAWYSGSVDWAEENGIVSGMGNGRFEPNGSITREQMAAVLYRYDMYSGSKVSIYEDVGLDSFSDSSNISSYAKEAMAWACGAGIISGSEGRLLPKEYADRAQTAQVIKNYFEASAYSLDNNPDTQIKNGSGPYNIMLSFTEDASVSAAVTWRDIPESSGGGVIFSNDKQKLSTYISEESNLAATDGIYVAEGESAEIKSGININESLWQTELTSLKPGCEYYYCVISAGGTSDIKSFRTAESEQKEVSFAYLGDIQFSDSKEEEYKDWGNMVSNMYKRNPDIAFALQGGDIVQSGIRPDEWQSFLDNASNVFSRIAFMPINGNHESNFPGGKPELYMDMFSLPENGPQGFKEEFYSFDYGNCHVTALNSWVFSGEQTLFENDFDSIVSWIKEDLKSAGSKWKIVIMHHPVYAVASDGVASQVKEKWAPIFENYGVDIVFCGHQHVYARSYPMRNGAADYVNGITYIMGNSGQKFYSSADETFQEKTIYNTSTYQIVRINGNSLELICYDKDGNELDYYTKSRSEKANAAA